MKAMILAAGKGTRVQPLTFDTPKPMLPVVKTPVLEMIIQHLAQSGVSEIAINTSHLGSEIESYFRDGRQFGVDISYSFEGVLENGCFKGEAIGSAGGLKRIQDFSAFFDDTFVVLCGDAIIDLDLQKLLKFHKEKGAVATIALKSVPLSEVAKYGVVKTNPDGRIDCFQEKPTPDEAISTMINTGIYIFDPKIFNYIPSGIEYDIGGDLFPSLVAANVPFYGLEMPFEWVDIGNVTDYWNANRDALNGLVNGHSLPGKEIRPGVFVGINVDVDLEAVQIEGPVYIGNGSSIGPGSRIIGPAVIGSNCVIEPGAVIEECFLDDYTRVSGIGRLRKYIVSNGRCIRSCGSYFEISDVDIGWVIEDARCSAKQTKEQDMISNLVKFHLDCSDTKMA